MSDIDPISLNYLLNKKTKLKFPLDCSVFEEVKDELSKEEIKVLMIDLGMYLAQLHKLDGEGFGFIEPTLLDNYQLKGNYKNWYQFLFEGLEKQLSEIEKVVEEEKNTREFKTKLSNENRRLMYRLLDEKEKVLQILNENKELLESVSSKFLNGNVYTKNITLRKNKFVGLIDFHNSLLGDPVYDLAYFSVMPGSHQYLQDVIDGWKKEINYSNFDQKLHLYRLIISYGKIVKRYLKYRYLEDYPEPLTIAQGELDYYNVK